jgi:putative PIN family toxin of toxin-antitoxin system
MQTRVVLDTNVLISGLIAEQGSPHKILDAWLDGCFTLVTSLYQVEEVNYVLSRPRIVDRIFLEQSELEVILAALLSKTEVVPGHLQLLGTTRDAKDDAIVACAREGQVDYLVSGDQDLLVLGDYEGIHVITPRRFLEVLGP